MDSPAVSSTVRGDVVHDAGRLADVRVTGSYPLTDPEASLRAISTGFALTLETAPDGSLTISR